MAYAYISFDHKPVLFFSVRLTIFRLYIPEFYSPDKKRDLKFGPEDKYRIRTRGIPSLFFLKNIRQHIISYLIGSLCIKVNLNQTKNIHSISN
ncbi:hypothetical protein SAMN05216331_1562 [Porphyromonadaceae bacterium KH3R12]|nr:hypothetical protein SAMN05216331_1562 [Porphyromonadaceae bacterium KH3R12]